MNRIISCFLCCTDTFTFDLYDKDGSGNLTHTEVEKMLEDIYGKNFHNSPQAKG